MILPLFFAVFKAEIKIPYQRCCDLANFKMRYVAAWARVVSEAILCFTVSILRFESRISDKVDVMKTYRYEIFLHVLYSRWVAKPALGIV